MQTSRYASRSSTRYLPHRLEYEANHGGRTYILDNTIIHVAPPDFQIVHLQEEVLRLYRSSDDLNQLATALCVDTDITRSLAVEIARNGSGFLSRLRFIEDEFGDDEEEERKDKASRISLCVVLASAGHEQPFRSLSTSEQFSVLIEFAAALARERARASPTLLLVDGGGWNLTDGSWALVARFLLSQPFQSAITPNYIRFDDPIWQSWSRVRLQRERSGASVLTKIIE